MSLEEGIKGLSIFQKHPHWLTELRDLFSLEFKEPWDQFDFTHKESDWDNIPFVIPRSVIILEKKMTKVQGWVKVKHAEIAKLSSGEFFDQIRLEMKGDKIAEQKYKDDQEKKFDKIDKHIKELYTFEEVRKQFEGKEVKEEGFFDQFFSDMDVNLQENEKAEHLIILSKEEKEEYEKLRKFSFKHLHYFFYKWLNRAQLKYRVSDLEGKLAGIEDKIERLFVKDLELDKKIFNEKNELRKEIQPKIDAVYQHIEDKVIHRLNDDEAMIQAAMESMEDIKTEAEENKAFREGLINKVDNITKKTNSFTTFFEGKLNQMNDDIKVLKAKTEERLSEFEALFNDNVERIIKEFETENERGKNDFIVRMDEFQHQNKEFLEKFSSSITKTVNVLQFETKRTLEDFADELHRNIEKSADSYTTIDNKLGDFIDKFNIYVKTKIEPAFLNQAKIDIIESRIQEQEDFSMKSSLFIREITKKLIFALQKHNLDHRKKDDDPQHHHHTKSEANSTFYVTELPVIQAVNKENDDDSNKSPHEPKSENIKFSPYDGFGLRANINATRFKGSKNKFVPIGVEGNTITHHLPPKSANINDRNPRERNSSMDMALTDAFQKNLNETFHKALKERGQTYDATLHKRLEVLKKALLDEEKVLPVNRPQTTDPRNSNPLKNFKDLPLVKVDDRGVSRRNRRTSSALNKTFSEFGDEHLQK